LRKWDDTKGQYFRFSPDFVGEIGLEESGELHQIRRLTVNWIDETETGRNFVACAEVISGRTGESLAHLVGEAILPGVLEELQERLNKLRKPKDRQLN